MGGTYTCEICQETGLLEDAYCICSKCQPQLAKLQKLALDDAVRKLWKLIAAGMNPTVASPLRLVLAAIRDMDNE